ncbi:hypothetical protein [Paenibacillus sp. Soil750]|uniref:hypothetical protein n=1 Tax=Paenibacillus sp. Soil750 TaxID=1736398 RepID=UPI0006F7A6C2|nr:hypothetical protein [Paenibacillus sp. Soil750]KRE59581.1 hypothetical protein ASL11_25465 [Paenibacillus sp. Soil750]
MKKIITFLSLFACSFLFVSFLMNNKNVSAAEKQINESFAAISEQINKEISLQSNLSFSSNPYDYIKQNADFDNIIKLGNDALPYLDKKLANSKQNGLQEYITAIAIERIAKLDLKENENTAWENGKGFSAKWNLHLKSIPSSVDAILTDKQLNSDDKVKKIIKLGTPAIPFIADKIERGDESLFPALIALTKDDGNKPVADETISNKKEWVTAHKSQYNNLKEYVLQK